ncbi:MAG TPA: outer membrane lipoprotein carrier protein LolA [Flavobacteriaceae bacterium]|nr:outer membrane lipoprotein carrier protein LolA [Flavobacteriaceae bacterium]
MRILSFVLFSFIFATVTSAQNSATQLLQEVSQKVKSYDNIQIEFKYNLNNTKERVSQETRGKVSLSGDKYLLEMLGIERIFDGKKIYTIVPEDEEVTISNFDPDMESEITPSRMLTFYEDGYEAEMDIKQNVKGREIQYVALKPINKNTDIKRILLGIDVHTKNIYKLIQIDNNDTKYTVTVQSFKSNQPISESLFQFDNKKYEQNGYYINALD